MTDDRVTSDTGAPDTGAPARGRPDNEAGDLTHVDDAGHVHMVDVGAKSMTDRVAVAEATVIMSEATADLVFGGGLPKGDVLASVRIAGIMGAKQTASLIPLCHPVSISAVTIDVERHPDGAVITSLVKTIGQTGVEMEALTAVSVAALALYDMVKGVERGVEIGKLRLLRKQGGRSGTWTA